MSPSPLNIIPHISAFYLMDLAGVAVFAVTGVMAAGQKKLDLFGVLVLATVTAIGGGTLRDVIIDRRVTWLSDHTYLWVIILTVFATMAFMRLSKKTHGHSLIVADALGLALFGISGAQIAEAFGCRGIVAVILGTMTGAAGGVLRDMLIGEIPLVLRDRALYATAAVVGISVYLALEMAGLPIHPAAAIGMAVIVILRFGSIFGKLRLPTFSGRE